MSAGLLALAAWPGAVAAQEKLARDASSAEVMAHTRAQGLNREGRDAAVSVLTQRYGPADRTELDALAGELVALILRVERDGAVLEFAVVSVDRREWRAVDPAPSRGLRPVTGTPVEEGCPATPWWR